MEEEEEEEEEDATRDSARFNFFVKLSIASVVALACADSATRRELRREMAAAAERVSRACRSARVKAKYSAGGGM